MQWLQVSNTSGPFAVTAPNTAVSLVGGSAQTVTWSVNNTTAASASCANVAISLSTDGGLTFPTVLAAGTPNDGSETLVIPNTPSNTARIKVEAVGNIFFDISNTDFTITAGALRPVVSAPVSVINNITVSPNPAGYSANLVFNSKVSGNATLIISSQMDGVVFNKTAPVVKGTNRKTLDLSKLINGLYYIKVQVGNDIQAIKIIVNK
jgi:hypothetical protein